MRQVLKFTKAIVSMPVRKAWTMAYAPNRVMNEAETGAARIMRIEVGSHPYIVARVSKGRLYTDRITNISIISDRALVPYVSWQYHDHDVLPDEQNHLLHRKILIDRPPASVHGTLISLLTGGGGNYNYYHWLFDCLPRLHIVRRAFGAAEGVKYLIPEDTHAFQRETLNALGIPASSCIPSNKHPHVQADELIATSHPNPDPSRIPTWIFELLRESFLKTSAPIASKGLVYISRGDSVNSRRLLNEQRLIDALRPIGFEVYRLSALSFSEQVALFAHARMVVAVHGAGLSNLVFASKGTVVYELFSRPYQHDMYESVSRIGELQYNKVVCETDGPVLIPSKADFHLSDEDITRIAEHARRVAEGGH